MLGRTAAKSAASINPTVRSSPVSTRRTISSPCGTGNGFSIAVYKKEKVKMLTLKPPAKTTTVRIVNARLRPSCRNA
jgi:hypothetical protein